MDREKYPNYFLFTIMAYALVFIFWFGTFFVPSLQFGFAYGEFYIIAFLQFLPVLLLAAYSQIGNIEFLWGKEAIVRYIIVAVTGIDAIFAVYMGLWML